MLISFVVHWIYPVSPKSPKKVKATNISAGNLLGFIGSFFAFTGTLYLGVLVWKQNQRFKDENNKAQNKLQDAIDKLAKANDIIADMEEESTVISKRLLDIEDSRDKLQLRPFVMVTDWDIETIDKDDIVFNNKKLFFDINGDIKSEKELSALKIYFTNTTESFLTVKYFGADISKGDKKINNWNIASLNQTNSKLYLNKGTPGTISFFAENSYLKQLEGKTITLNLILENRLSETYKLKIDLIVAHINFAPKYLYVMVQNYRISKFIKGPDGKPVLEEEI